MNKVSHQYYKKIHHLFPILGSEEKQFLEKFKEHLESYEKKYPNQSYNDYLEYFGNPKDIISIYYEHIESEYIISHMKSRKIIKYLSITFICVFIITSLTLVFFRYKEYQLNKEDQYFYTEEITDVENSQ